MANIPVVYYVDNITTPTQSVNLAVNGISFANNLDTTPTGIAINSSGIAYNTGSATQTTTWSNLSTRVAQLVAVAPNPTATTLAVVDTLTLENAATSPSATVNIQANNSAGVGTQFGLSFNDSLNSNFTVSTSGTGKLSITSPVQVTGNAIFSQTIQGTGYIGTSLNTNSSASLSLQCNSTTQSSITSNGVQQTNLTSQGTATYLSPTLTIVTTASAPYPTFYQNIITLSGSTVAQTISAITVPTNMPVGGMYLVYITNNNTSAGAVTVNATSLGTGIKTTYTSNVVIPIGTTALGSLTKIGASAWIWSINLVA